jgi:hypothetical protein
MPDELLSDTDHGISRRGFIRTSVALAGSSLLHAEHGLGPANAVHPAQPIRRSRVVQVQSRLAVQGPVVRRPLLIELLERSLTSLTGMPTLTEAWRSILKPDDIIGLKFNRSGQEVIATTDAMADVLISSLVESGWGAEQIVCIEAPEGVCRRHQTTPANLGFEPVPSRFGNESDFLASVVGQVTAIINVPYLKTHNIASLTCAMKNLSHAFVKHPAQYHRNGCSPFVSDIVSIPAVRDKLRLCIVDALRVVFEGGPEARVETLSDEGVLLASFDPVATDAIGFDLLNGVRWRRGLPSIARSAMDVPYLQAAHSAGLGTADRVGIELNKTVL